MGDKIVVRRPGEGDAIGMLGGLYEVKAKADETNGALSVMEVTVPVGMAPPPHIHSGGEAVYVLEGTLRYHIGGEVMKAGPGTFFYFPQGTIETFEPETTCRLLLVYAPGGMDAFFAEAGDPLATHTVPPQPGPPDVERLVEIGSRHGLQLLPPG
jgi:quercetin dioxygenase-like cupin family protein